MKVVNRKDYEKMMKIMNLSMESNENCIDVYHKNNWDRLTIHFNEALKDERVSYIKFFFNAKEIIDFMKSFIKNEKFEKCYIASLYNEKYKLKLFEDDVCKDIYDEFKRLLNSLGLKTNTSCAIEMNKEELLSFCDIISIGAFSGVLEYIIVIPELKIVINPHHHMNYLIYSDNREVLLTKINADISGEIDCYY